MSKKRRFPVWILPILGIILGIILANLQIRGAFSFWVKARNSSGKIVRIIGNTDQYNLLVESSSGETLYVHTLHCWIYDNNGHPWVYSKAQPERDYAAEYLLKPLRAQVKQTYDIAYFADGAKGFERFALTENGDLWYWNFCNSGYLELNYCIYPLFGLFVGGMLSLMIAVISVIVGLLKRTASQE